MRVRTSEDAVVARLQALAPHLDGEPDPDFRTATRARLVAMAAVRSPAPAPGSPLRRVLTDGVPAAPRWRARLTAGLAGAALGVTALAAVVGAASDARPGDLLYDVKRGTEETQLALAGDSRGEKLLDLASTRLDEVRALVESGATALPAVGAPAPGSGQTVLATEADPALMVETLDTMDAQTTEGAARLTERAVASGDGAPLELLAGWAAEQSDGLAALRNDVPAAAADDVTESLVLLSDIATRLSGLDSALDCAAGPATTVADALGPVPTSCLTEQPVVPGGETTSANPDLAGTGTEPLPQAPGQPQPSVPGLSDVPPLPGGTEDGGVQTSDVPLLPTDAVPTLPSTSLPGTSSSTETSTETSDGLLDVCLGPVRIGDC
jgi:hypothetical protein